MMGWACKSDGKVVCRKGRKEGGVRLEGWKYGDERNVISKRSRKGQEEWWKDEGAGKVIWEEGGGV
jgi:hypothetical protein